MRNRPTIAKSLTDDSVDRAISDKEEVVSLDKIEVESTEFDPMEEEDSMSDDLDEQKELEEVTEDQQVVVGDGDKSDSESCAESPGSILDRIANMDDDDIGKYGSFLKPFQELLESTKKIRSDGEPYDSDFTDRMDDFANTDEHHAAFEGFSGVYEFVFHLFNVFNVKLKSDIPEVEEYTLRYIIETTCGKYSVEMKNLRNMELTLSIQFTLVKSEKKVTLKHFQLRKNISKIWHSCITCVTWAKF